MTAQYLQLVDNILGFSHLFQMSMLYNRRNMLITDGMNVLIKKCLAVKTPGF